jgi:hypothetical protein
MTVHDNHNRNNIHRITNDDSQEVEEEILLERETAIHFSSFHALLRLVKEFRFASEGDATTTSPSEVKAVVVAPGLTQEQILPSSTSASVSVSSLVSVSSESVISTNQDDAANDTAGSSVVVPELIEVESPSPQPSRQLPSDVCIRVVQWLVVERVNMEHVTAIGCSSQYIDPNRMALRNTATPMSSSSSSSFPTKSALLSFLSDCLSDDDATWWISKEGLDDRYQYVDFRCVPTTTTTVNHTTTTNVSLYSSSSSLQPLPSYPLHRVRVRAVSLKIPPLPQGPMSLRGFVLQKSDHIDSSSSTSTTASTNNNNNNINNTMVWETISPLWTLESRSGWQRFVLQDTDGPFDVRYLRILCLSNQIAALNDRRFRGLPQAVGFSCIKLD